MPRGKKLIQTTAATEALGHSMLPPGVEYIGMFGRTWHSDERYQKALRGAARATVGGGGGGDGPATASAGNTPQTNVGAAAPMARKRARRVAQQP